MKKKKPSIWPWILAITFSILLLVLAGIGGYVLLSDDDIYVNKSNSAASSLPNEAGHETLPVSEGNLSETQNIEELYNEDITMDEATEIVAKMDNVAEVIEQFENNYRKRKDITIDNCWDYIYDLKNYLDGENLSDISNMYIYNNTLVFEYAFMPGLHSYSPVIEGYDRNGGNSSDYSIVTYQPYESTYTYAIEEQAFVDQGAGLIDGEFDYFSYDDRDTSDDDDYNNEEVTIESILEMSQHEIVLWHGHGGYMGPSIGCVLGTTIEASAENLQRYHDEIAAGYFITGNAGGMTTLAITSTFFEHYFTNNAFDNSIVYLAACSSGADDSLINALLGRGALAVYANREDIPTVYNLTMMRNVCEGLTQETGDSHMTLEEALEYAYDHSGPRDEITYLTYAPGFGNISLDWFSEDDVQERDVVLVLDRSGSMDGDPMEQTKEAAGQFVDTVFEKDSRVGLVTYDDDITVNSGLTNSGLSLKGEINELSAGGSTNIYGGLEAADQILGRSKAQKKIIVLMSDGLPNEGATVNGSYEQALIEYAENMKNQGYYIYTLGFFSSVYGEEKTGAQALMESIASPGLHYEVDTADDLIFFFDDIASQIGGKQYVYIRIECPVDVKVSSGGEELNSDGLSENKRTSFGTLSYEEIVDEDGNYDQAKILRLDMEKNYDIEINGYDNGTMNYIVNYPNENGEYTDVRKFPGIAVSPEMSAVSNTKKDDATQLKVDGNGDGKYETTYETESNGLMKEVKDHTILYICLGIGVLVLIALTIGIIIILKSVKRSKEREMVISEPIPFGRSSAEPEIRTFIIGRDSECDIVVKHKKVSRIHATATRYPDGSYVVVDGSANGTFYNGAQLERGKEYHLPCGAIIFLGSSKNAIKLE